jgi:hypothetical protein
MEQRLKPTLSCGLMLGLVLWWQPAAALSPASAIGWRIDASGPLTAQSLTLYTELPVADRGQSIQHFVAAQWQGQWYCPSGADWRLCGADLSPWGVVESSSWVAAPLGSVDTQALRGVQLWAGYGESAAEMLASGRYRQLYTLGPAAAVTWEAASTVPTTGGAYLAFNNTAVALRDATGALHLVWDDTQQGYHGRHDGSTWQVQTLPKVGAGRVSKVSLAALTSGELVATWSEDERGQRSVVVARTEDLRSRWTSPLVLATGSFDAPVALHVYRRADASDGAAVAWMDTANNRLQVRAWSGSGWTATDWSVAVSPAAAAAQPHDVALAGRGAQVWALWEDQRAGGPTEIYLSHSDDGGVTWHPDQRLPLASGSAGGGDPSAVALSDGTLLVAWQGQGRVQYARSTTSEATAFGAPRVIVGLSRLQRVSVRGESGTACAPMGAGLSLRACALAGRLAGGGAVSGPCGWWWAPATRCWRCRRWWWAGGLPAAVALGAAGLLGHPVHADGDGRGAEHPGGAADRRAVAPAGAGRLREGGDELRRHGRRAAADGRRCCCCTSAWRC